MSLILCALLVVALPSWASNPPHPLDAHAIAKRVDRHYNRLHTLSVQFTETYTGMGIKRTESGVLLLAKPGRMKWTYSRPSGKIFLVDGKYGYFYSPGDPQAQRYPAKQLNDFRSPLRFLLGHTRVEKELTNLTAVPTATGFQLSGIPKGMSHEVSQVDLTVSADGTIRQIEWKETGGAVTDFALSNEKPNPPIAPRTFVFQAPPGVVIVRGLAPM